MAASKGVGGPIVVFNVRDRVDIIVHDVTREGTPMLMRTSVCSGCPLVWCTTMFGLHVERQDHCVPLAICHYMLARTVDAGCVALNLVSSDSVFGMRLGFMPQCSAFRLQGYHVYPVVVCFLAPRSIHMIDIQCCELCNCEAWKQHLQLLEA